MVIIPLLVFKHIINMQIYADMKEGNLCYGVCYDVNNRHKLPALYFLMIYILDNDIVGENAIFCHKYYKSILFMSTC